MYDYLYMLVFINFFSLSSHYYFYIGCVMVVSFAIDSKDFIILRWDPKELEEWLLCTNLGIGAVDTGSEETFCCLLLGSGQKCSWFYGIWFHNVSWEYIYF